MNGLKRQKGTTLVELMVAVLIGTLSMYAVYQTFEVSERTKRTVASVGSAQISGLYSTFLLEESIQNAGSGLMANGTALAHCPNDPIGAPDTPSGTSVALSLKPLPVVIDPTDNANFDDIYVFGGRSSRNIVPLTVSGGNADTPFGFKQDTVLVDVKGACAPYLVTADIAPQQATETVNTSVSAHVLGADGAPPDGASLIDLGEPSRLRFFVDDKNTLQVEVWRLNPGLPTDGQWVRVRTDPVIPGVMLLKAQYGIDTTVSATNRGTGVTNWVDATTAPWDMETLQEITSFVPAAQIKAIRLAIIVRADEPENSATFNQDTQFTVFQNCPVGDCTAAPPIPITFDAGSGPGGTTYRYRMYEKVIPLRNTIWNPI
ncbi:MAG: PilW family protein [Burkholderiales bacterium]|jgi:type IV pilus assembly protein PilW|nr:PilW family protein [Burkholderiales bacterium]